MEEFDQQNTQPFVSTAPCRICLFGEHQDYLGYPVIAAAVSLRCHITVQPSVGSKSSLLLEIPQMNSLKHYDLENLGSTSSDNPDFALSSIHVALAHGWELTGARCVSSVDLPMQAGCSTSSAFIVAWINALHRLAGRTNELDPLNLAKLAYEAEVEYFNAPGGTMDHVACACGGLLRIGGPSDPWEAHSLPFKDSFGLWVLAYSGQPKDTLGHLKRCKQDRLQILDKLSGSWDNNASCLDEEERVLLETTLINRDTERRAYGLWIDPAASTATAKELGGLLGGHHRALRDGLGLSTTVLESMNEAAIGAGAWGFKVVGSGGGGCGVAWVQSSLVHDVENAMMNAGATACWILDGPSHGARITEHELDKE